MSTKHESEKRFDEVTEAGLESFPASDPPSYNMGDEDRVHTDRSPSGGRLAGKRIAFLATHGVEQIELTEPREAFESAGAHVDLVSPESDCINAMQHLDPGDSFEVDRPLADADPDDYDALVLPGGVANPDMLRMNSDAVRFVKRFFEQGKPVAAICHGPWVLVEANVVRGRTLTSWPSLKTDIQNAGGRWVDEQVHVDKGLVTSRKPDDLEAFCNEAMTLFAAAAGAGAGHAVQ